MRFLELAAFAGLAWGASLKPVTSFGANPTSLQMYLYVPDKLAEKPPVIVAVSQTIKNTISRHLPTGP